MRNVLYDLCLSPNGFRVIKSSRKEMSGKCGTYVELRGSVVVPEGKRQLGSPRFRWEGNFKMEPPSI